MQTVMTGVPAEAKKTKEERMKDYIKAIATIEAAMEPYKDQKKDLRKNYVDNGWLTKEEMKAVMKAYRLKKDDTDFDQLEHVYDTITK
jgi:hypothetical protein